MEFQWESPDLANFKRLSEKHRFCGEATGVWDPVYQHAVMRKWTPRVILDIVSSYHSQ